jgi:branched-chain amino acid transport system ATP-binding protein
MSAALLSVERLYKRFGGLMVTDDVSLTVKAGEIHALIGPNGAGKTTLIRQLCGDLRQDSGVIRLAGEAIGDLVPPLRVARGLARTFQIAQLMPEYTSLENVILAVQAQQGTTFRLANNPRADQQLRETCVRHLGAVGLGARTDTSAAVLSQGERKELELAIALATGPRLLLLDEPMAGLGQSESARMIGLLQSLKGQCAMLLVEHDLEAVFALADRISVLVHGRVIASGPVATIRDDPLVHEAYFGEHEH